MEMLLGIFSAFGLSASAGLNAYIPLLVIGVIAHYFPRNAQTCPALGPDRQPLDIDPARGFGHHRDGCGQSPCGQPHQRSDSNRGPPCGGSDCLCRQRKGHHRCQPCAGSGCGLLMAGGVHVVKAAALRPAVTATTGGAGNVPVSIAEDILAFFASVFAVLLPIVMGSILVILLALVLWWLWRRTDKAQTA